MKALPLDSSRLPRFLFRVSFLACSLLVGLVLISPLFDDGVKEARGAAKIPALFARDVTMRRTALGVSIGLGATASIFYWPQIRGRRNSSRAGKMSAPPENAVGA